MRALVQLAIDLSVPVRLGDRGAQEVPAGGGLLAAGGAQEHGPLGVRHAALQHGARRAREVARLGRRPAPRQVHRTRAERLHRRRQQAEAPVRSAPVHSGGAQRAGLSRRADARRRSAPPPSFSFAHSHHCSSSLQTCSLGS